MFEKIDIGIRTFLRDEKLFHAIQGIRDNYPGARMVIVDDGDQTDEKDGIYSDLVREGHIVDILPFDSGFGKKSNRIAELTVDGNRPYLLIASDDFIFDKQAADGLTELQRVQDSQTSVDIVSGRVNNRPYEFFLDIKKEQDGIHIREISLSYYNTNNMNVCRPWVYGADLTVNYSLITKRVLELVGWDDDVKIGNGEHGAFFYDCLTKGFKTVYVENVNINEQPGRDSQRYREYRNRAQSPERLCFDKRGIVEYILGDGRIDYRRRQ